MATLFFKFASSFVGWKIPLSNAKNTRTNQYLPDYIVRPGEVLEEYLENLSMTQAELATRTGLTRKTINKIIKGKSPITHETALKFERTLGRPAHFWNNLEQQFQEAKSSIRLGT